MKKIYLLPLTLCLSFFSCDFDQFPTESISYEDVFRDRLLIVLPILGLVVLLVLGILLSFFTGQIVTPLTKLQLAVQAFEV